METPALPSVARSTATCFLFDNGSLRAASTLSLRGMAAELGRRISMRVEPVSLLHSSGVNSEELGGVPARLLEPALVEFFSANPSGRAYLSPLFFGPSAALTDYVPVRMAAISTRFPEASVVVAKWLVLPEKGDGQPMVDILADRVRQTMADRGLIQPAVVLVDHGSPQPAVTAVRDHFGKKLAAALAGEVRCVAVASMERRAGPEYAFNDPLLADCLRRAPCDRGDVVVALQFLSPGRHAGPDGDVSAICRDAESANPGLRTHMTSTMSGDARLIDMLALRLRQALGTD